ncbi:BspA family leucine-rich repeat surface protein, partial [Allomuricauda sp. F6463D]|uniref:BspA family leucine-rich repeat surface protein n=1 Tax=Allomuricauda sp. F6463D TaxID=2926409 RepID=UPI001FF3F433
SLADGKELDFETAEEHVLTVTVTDGTESVDATITITVVNVIESMFEDPASFITTWEVPENNFELEIGTNDDFDYDFTIDWGDGTIEQLVDLQDPTHVYATAGTYKVAIQGDFPQILVTNSSYHTLRGINQWGAIEWKSFHYAFSLCLNMEYHATDMPDLSQVSELEGMFYKAESFNGDISGWDVSNVTDMSLMFSDAISFDQNLSGWDIGMVTSMVDMFNGSGMSALNFSNTLIGWAAMDVQPNVKLGANNIDMCVSVQDAYNTLIDAPNNWNIVYNAVVACN